MVLLLPRQCGDRVDMDDGEKRLDCAEETDIQPTTAGSGQQGV